MTNSFTTAIAISLLAVFAPGLRAQAVSIASVTGRVADEQGASVAGAQIRMTGVETGGLYTAASNSDGIYTFPSLPIGAYTLQSTVPGFQTYVQSGIILSNFGQITTASDPRILQGSVKLTF